MTCALNCATAREAACVAGELRELPGVRVSMHACGRRGGWVVELEGPPVRLDAREIAQRLDRAQPRERRPRRPGSAHAARGRSSQRETVIASLLRRPYEDAA